MGLRYKSGRRVIEFLIILSGDVNTAGTGGHFKT
jgi:hypothetical protein